MKKLHKKILIIGIRHGTQDNGHFQKRMKFLKSKKFSKTFIKTEKAILLMMRGEMLKIIKESKPDVIFEECSPWIKKPGDTWKKYTGSKKTILENMYPERHMFVDARMLKSEKKPSVAKREEAIIKQIIKTFKKNKFNKGILVIGAYHLKNIVKLLRKESFKIVIRNLKNKKELKKLIKKRRTLDVRRQRRFFKD